MSARIGDRLSAARHQQIVGRLSEIALFQSALDTPDLPFCLLYVFGPGGVGKTTLLRAFASHCQDAQVPSFFVDAQSLEPAPEAFLNALQQAMGLTPPSSPLQSLAGLSRRCVLLVDSYDVLEPLDGWMRDVFLPQLPEDVLVVLASHRSPAPAWRTNPGWQPLFRALPLRNFSPMESRTYLLHCGVPPEQHPAVLRFTHGHPLALSLVADVSAQHNHAGFPLEPAPTIVQTLLERFLEKAPDPAHRTALSTCALIRQTTESVLSGILQTPDAHDLFEWLRHLSFVETGWHGLVPHDLAREALLADLRWRNPDQYADLHRRAGAYYAARLQQTHGQEQRRLLWDYIFLHRDNPVVRSLFEWQESVPVIVEPAGPADRSPLVAMVTRHEGRESARLMEHWLTRQPEGTLAFREALDGGDQGDPVGFLTTIALHQVSAEDRKADPAVAAAWRYLERNAPLRPGEKACLFRFWMARESYQDVSMIQSQIMISVVRHYLTTPGLAFSFFPCAAPEIWEAAFAYAETPRLGAADFVVGGRSYAMFGHDWRRIPPEAWLTLLRDREIAGSQPATPPPIAEPLVVLSHPDFVAAVREALRSYSQPNRLHENPLLFSRLVVNRVGAGAGGAQKVASLRTLLREAIEELQSSPRLARGYRALYYTYLHPAITQEQAAEVLGLPFSTYRRHLTEGTSSVTEILWYQETAEK